MKRLQEGCRGTVVSKERTGLALTEAGEMTLRMGRRMLALNDDLIEAVRGSALAGHVRLGFSQDFADTVLPAVLGRFVRLYVAALPAPARRQKRGAARQRGQSVV